jgi:hypothetical protein
MLRIIVAAVVAFSFAVLDSADAASKRKKPKVRHVAPIVVPAPYARTPGPPWAGPGECYTDEGYGRYLPCGAGMDM